MSDGYKMEKKRGERMYCRKCGAQLPKHAKFCRKCGTAVPENHTGEVAARYGPTIAAFLTVMLILMVCLVKSVTPGIQRPGASEEMTAAVKEALTEENSIYAQAARQQAEQILAGADEDGVISYPVLRQTAEAAAAQICGPDEVTITVNEEHRSGSRTTADITVLSRDVDSVMKNFLDEISEDRERGNSDVLSLLMKKAENGSLERYVTSRVKIAAEETAQNIEVSGQIIVVKDAGTYRVESADDDICRAVNGIRTADSGTSIRTAAEDEQQRSDLWNELNPQTWIGKAEEPEIGDLTGYPYSTL